MDASSSIPIVAICTSARSGVEPLRRFFRHLPTGGIDAALLVIAEPGSDPLVQALRRESPLLVREVGQSSALEKNAVHVIPAGCELKLEGRQLQVGSPGRQRSARAWLGPLAHEAGDRAAVVFLAEPGTDRPEELRLITSQLGLVIALDPDHTGVADLVLGAEEMPGRLLEWRTAGSDREPSIPTNELRDVLATLQQRTGHDFSGYRPSTLLRRIERQRRLRGLDGIAAYARLLASSPEAVAALDRALLVGVTEFFRDPDRFLALAQALAEQLGARPVDEPVRIWVAACSTGEEAYSLAMVAQEAVERLGRPRAVKVFATDIDERAIEHARQGWFTESAVAGIPADRLERFFRQDPGGFAVEPALRSQVVFAVHDLLRDPPFRRMDVVSCRNLLIYLDVDARRRALAQLHGALGPDGLLMLGSCESPDAVDGAFAPLPGPRGIYRRLDPERPLVASGALSIPRSPGSYAQLALSTASSAMRARDVDHWLAETYAPAAAVVTPSGDVLHVHGHTGRLFELPEGGSKLNVLEMSREGLRAPLESLLREVERCPEKTVARDARVSTDTGTVPVRIVARSLRSRSRRGEILLSFEPTARGGGRSRGSYRSPLDADLPCTHSELQDAAAALQASNEELVSRNEELLSTNEDLLSANQLLATSRAQVEALNERLQETNTELQDAGAETRLGLLRTRAVLDATFDGVVSADLNGRIELVNPALCELFGYAVHELVGARLTALVPTLRVPEPAPSDGVPRLRRVAHDLRLTGLRKNGETFPVRVSLVEGRDRDRRILVGTLRDLTPELEAQRSLRREAGAAVRAEEIERRKLASELHDDLGQTLALAGMRLAALGRTAASRNDEIEGIAALIRDALKRTESLTSQLSPAVLRDFGFVPAVEWLALEIERGYGLRVEVVDDREPKALDEVARVALFRAVRELLINVARHAKVQCARVSIAREGEAVRVEVEDEGIGMDPRLQERGLGLTLARERLRNLGGSLRIESVAGEGTRAVARVPLRPESDAELAR